MKVINKFSVAPMMDLTDRHCRFFHRKLSEKALLYTEMITSKAILYGNTRKLLKFNPAERPLALQVGGSDPAELGQVASIAEELGFDEINLNVGCPSSKVKSGCFGAILMRNPGLVSKCVEAMKCSAKNMKVSVKCRIGVDQQDPSVTLPAFISSVSNGGADYFIIHARKAILSGLNPKENRTIPPLDYSIVKSMKEKFPDLAICLNGGISSLDAASDLFSEGFDGVMLGRASYYYPEIILSRVDSRLFGIGKPKNMIEVISELIPYIDEELDFGTRLSQITKHLMRAFLGYKNAKEYRRYLSENAFKKGANSNVLLNALSIIDPN